MCCGSCALRVVRVLWLSCVRACCVWLFESCVLLGVLGVVAIGGVSVVLGVGGLVRMCGLLGCVCICVGGGVCVVCVCLCEVLFGWGGVCLCVVLCVFVCVWVCVCVVLSV